MTTRNIKILALLLFASCSTYTKENKKDTPVNSLADVLANLAPTTETFEINVAEETTLTGKKGTIVYIPTDIFQFADGTTPDGKINIELKECYTLADMIAENLQTTSEHHLLETAGMIYLNATANGKQLAIKDGKAFVIGFPKNNRNEQMDLFYDFPLNDTASTWIVDYKIFEAEAVKADAQADASPTEGDTALLEGDTPLRMEYPIEMTDDLYDYGFLTMLHTAALDEIPLQGQSTSISDFIDNPSNIDGAIAREFYEKGWVIEFNFNIDKDGVMNNFRVMPHERTTRRGIQIAENFLRSIPPFDLASYHEKVDPNLDYALTIMGTYTINWNRFKEKFREQYSLYRNDLIQKMDKSDLDYYIFSATKMNWINCDRFWDIKDEKADFVVKVQAPNDTKVQIVFSDINSIMNGTLKDGQFVFNNVPLNRKIKVIGITYTNGKPTMAITETTINTDSFELTAFREFTLDQLEAELNTR